MQTGQDTILMQEFKEGSVKAEREIFNRSYRPLSLYAAEITIDVQQAEDIVTEAFKKVFDRRMEFEALDNLRAFLYKIIRNAVINSRHQQKNRYRNT